MTTTPHRVLSIRLSEREAGNRCRRWAQLFKLCVPCLDEGRTTLKRIIADVYFRAKESAPTRYVERLVFDSIMSPEGETLGAVAYRLRSAGCRMTDYEIEKLLDSMVSSGALRRSRVDWSAIFKRLRSSAATSGRRTCSSCGGSVVSLYAARAPRSRVNAGTYCSACGTPILRRELLQVADLGE